MKHKNLNKDIILNDIIHYGNQTYERNNWIDDIMYNIYKYFGFDTQNIPLNERLNIIDEFINDVYEYVDKIDIHIPICILMCTFLPRRKLKNRTKFYNKFKEHLLTIKSEKEVSSILCNLE